MKKRRILSLVVAAILLVSTLTVVGLLNVTAAEVSVATADALLEAIADDSAATIKLADDIDMTDKGTIASFSGTIDGGDHTVTVNAPLFATLSGEVKNLTLVGEITATANELGALANYVNGNLTVTNVINDASVTSADNKTVGGFIGKAESSSNITISFTNCINNGNVTGGYGVSGFVAYGTNSSATTAVNFSYCVNNGELDAKAGAQHNAGTGSFFGFSYKRTTVTIDCCVNTGDITDVGGDYGIGGLYGGGRWTSSEYQVVTVKKSANFGDITVNGANRVGGIVGRLNKYSTCSATIIDCYNAGDITSTGSYPSQILSYCNQDSGSVATLTNCYGYGVLKNGDTEVGHDTSGNVPDSKSVTNYPIAWANNNKITISNCYYVGVDKTGSDAKCLPNAEAVAQKLVTDGSAYIVNPDQNDGYPILAWQCEHSATYTCKGECFYCGEVIGEAGECSWGEWAETTPAGNFTAGEETRVCSVCEAEETCATDPKCLVDGVYEIGTEDLLLEAVELLNDGTLAADSDFKLTADITLTSGMDMISINYTGTFDGGEHTISGINNTMFKLLDDGSVVKNLTVDGTITGTDRMTSSIARRVENATVVNVHSSANVTLTATDLNAGGLLGYVLYATTVEDCSYSGTLTANWTSGANAGVGGIVGWTNASLSEHTQTITGCTFDGTIIVNAEAEGKTLWLGGIDGSINCNGTVNITNCESNGKIIVNEMQVGSYNVAGIAGRYIPKAGGTIDGCTVTTKFSVPAAATFEGIACNVGSEATITNSTVSGDNFLTAGEDMFTGYLQTRDNGEYHDVRIVLVANLEKLMAEVNDATVTITFKKGEEVAKTIELDLATEFEFYQKATAAGEVFFAEDGYALFGAIVTDIPDGAWDTLLVNIVSDAEASLYSAATSYEG